MIRENTKVISIGGCCIGGKNPIAIQSMCNTKTEDVKSTVAQILALEEAGCDIIRVAVPTMEAAEAIKAIKKQIHIPLVGDIHFDYRLAIAAMENGVDKIRINPGNIGSADRVKAVIEDYDYDQMVISIKSSDVMMCIKAHELIARQTDYPLHVGITESGTLISGNIKSAVGLGIMLNEGIGNTIRVSLTGNPVEEIKSAKLILRTLGLRKGGIEVVSCPTCGRTQIDLIGLANQVENMVQGYDLDLKVAVMGCVVNGPGEAKEADLGIAGGKGEGLLIRKGEIVKKVPESELLAALKDTLDNWSE